MPKNCKIFKRKCVLRKTKMCRFTKKGACCSKCQNLCNIFYFLKDFHRVINVKISEVEFMIKTKVKFQVLHYYKLSRTAFVLSLQIPKYQ